MSARSINTVASLCRQCFLIFQLEGECEPIGQHWVMFPSLTEPSLKLYEKCFTFTT